ncbi:MAG: esterase [Paracoccaceae bacterium]|nr:MAG: esterase [Paracoccaceae bacterium]
MVWTLPGDGPLTDWDAAYDNAAHVPDSAAYGPRWQAEAAAFREALGPRARTELPYGPGARQRFDLFLPETEPRGLFVFVHGGYWRARHRSDWSHLAAGPLAHGWAVAMPGYTLCPAATLPDIRAEIAAAIARAAEEVAGPILLSGHSAGGHLVTRAICTDAAPGPVRRVAGVASISGLHDLRPLLRTSMVNDLRLDAETARAESPALLTPVPGIPVLAWVGASELAEFRRQAALIANAWYGLGVDMRLAESPGDHHFSVIEPLADPGSDLVAAILGMAGEG